MAVSKEKWGEAFQLLYQFERKIIDPSEFSWAYLVSELGISKPTMWRNAEFRSEHDRVSKLVNKYKNKQADYDLETSKLSKKDQEIAELKQRIISLEQELDHERERLAYAALIARQNNIDPNLFEKETPLIKARAVAAKKEKTAKMDVLDLDRFRSKS
ncbi:conserved hypothetical protein [methanotrophic bacterial endosymbiont of Bathymodiolus sp.]|jgi:hypothetical protein|nr:conserved hypothetical protein [methanotrophic bacterial endosymbiont of Bathymodiolus sp.]